MTFDIMTEETTKITHEGKDLELPVVRGSEQETAIDISKLRGQSGLITYDPGYANTGSCQSSITFIDGEKGILRYRGYPIEQLAEKSNFLEVSWLLIHGELPSAQELAEFTETVTRHTMLHENFQGFFNALPKDAHPMPVTAATVGALSTFYQEAETEESIQQTIIRLMAKFPTIAAAAYKHSIGQPTVYPLNELDYSTNFLNMMFSTPCEDYEVNPAIAKALDVLLILHADHEQNCSTSTVRMVGSSQANLYASISAGISALWGRLHGGANQKVIEMLDAITERGETAEQFVERAKDRDNPARLMGFGHRVYKNYDPRAAVLKSACNEVIEILGISSNQLEIAMKLEEIALNDEFFIERKLFPNVDFYSGVIYKALGIPVNMFTVMFAMGRMSGWISQWLEMRRDPSFRIGRPRQVYTGATVRDYVPVSNR